MWFYITSGTIFENEICTHVQIVGYGHDTPAHVHIEKTKDSYVVIKNDHKWILGGNKLIR